MKDDGDLVIKANGLAIEGWTDIRVTLGMERCPNDFALSMTERFDGELKEVVIAPGSACEVEIKNSEGSSKVITGYVDAYDPSLSAMQHSVSLRGRGKCQDIVDCSAKYAEGAFRNMTLPQIASILAKPFDIGVYLAGTEAQGETAIPSFPIMYGETTMEIIERVTRYLGLSAYEDRDGNLVMANTSDELGGAVVEGKNFKSGAASFTMDQRYSEYSAYLVSIDNFNDAPGHETALNAVPSVKDAGVPRYRPHIAIDDNGDANYQVTQARLAYECNRRRGRSQRLTVIVDSWRNADGKLWKPNTKVSVSAPTLRVGIKEPVLWTLGQVTYIRNETQGTVAELVLMPPEAFSVQPIVFIPSPLIEYTLPPTQAGGQ